MDFIVGKQSIHWLFEGLAASGALSVLVGLWVYSRKQDGKKKRLKTHSNAILQLPVGPPGWRCPSGHLGDVRHDPAYLGCWEGSRDDDG